MSICSDCELRLHASGQWPRHRSSGAECCQVVQGAHVGVCDVHPPSYHVPKIVGMTLDGITVRHPTGVTVDISWSDLRAAAASTNELGRIDELVGVYRTLLTEATRIYREGVGELDAQLPRVIIRVRVSDELARGAAWHVEVSDVAGARRDLMLADEGGQHPRYRMAEEEAREIADRLRRQRFAPASRVVDVLIQ